MRLGITTKLVIGIALVLLLAFAGLALITLHAASENSGRLVQSVLDDFRNSSRASNQAVGEGFQSTRQKLAGASTEIRALFKELHETGCKKAVESLASQIHPSIESFAYDDAGKIAANTIAQSHDIRWIRLAVSPHPKPNEVFEFGQKLGEDSQAKLFTWESPGTGAYLKIEMQIELSDLNGFIQRMDKVFEAVTQENSNTADSIHTIGEQTNAHTATSAWEIVAQGRRELRIRTVPLILLTLLLASGVLALFVRRTLVRPLRNAITILEGSSDRATAVSGQFFASSQHLAQGATRQTQTIEHTSSSMTQVAAKTKQAAEHAGETQQIMSGMRQIVSQATQSMQNLTGSMTTISAASEQTRKVIRTIDEIASQTNLLALNAAVEAARAGQAGVGFAVVAAEVRRLAVRTAEAAKSTAGMIEDTVNSIRDGLVVVEQTNKDFMQVNDGVSKAADLMKEIASASQQQTREIESINQAVAEIETVTQRNAVDAEQAASGSLEMKNQSEETRDLLRKLERLVNGSRSS